MKIDKLKSIHRYYIFVLYIKTKFLTKKVEIVRNLQKIITDKIKTKINSFYIVFFLFNFNILFIDEFIFS